MALSILALRAMPNKHISDSPPAPSAPAKPTVAVVNSPWDGSVYQVERYLKRTLKDPDSLEVITWYDVLRDGPGFKVRCTYRAKNSFGGYVVEDRVFLLDKDGNVKTVLNY